MHKYDKHRRIDSFVSQFQFSFSRRNQMKKFLFIGPTAILLCAGLVHLSLASENGQASASLFFEKDARSLAALYIHYYKTIPLTVVQARIKDEALASIPAPCCSDNSIKTCCCPCNLAKATWGLTHYLIAEKNYKVQQVRQTVLDWIQHTNPKGYSGNACYIGRCAKPFAKNGCGGMNDRHIF